MFGLGREREREVAQLVLGLISDARTRERDPDGSGRPPIEREGATASSVWGEREKTRCGSSAGSDFGRGIYSASFQKNSSFSAIFKSVFVPNCSTALPLNSQAHVSGHQAQKQ